MNGRKRKKTDSQTSKNGRGLEKINRGRNLQHLLSAYSPTYLVGKGDYCEYWSDPWSEVFQNSLLKPEKPVKTQG